MYYCRDARRYALQREKMKKAKEAKGRESVGPGGGDRKKRGLATLGISIAAKAPEGGALQQDQGFTLSLIHI